MCGRYTIYQTGELKSRYQITGSEQDELLSRLRANYNVAPGQKLPVITRHSPNRIEIMRWGLIPVWAKDERIGYKMINARAETVFEKSTWKRPILTNRCLVPANGFYEWQTTDDGKQPFFIRLRNIELFSFAGIYDRWTHKETGEVIHSYSILTTDANREMQGIHDRMPVILKPEEEDRWLEPSNDTPESIADLLKPFEDGMLEAYEVSTDVNSPRHNDESLIYPINHQ